LRVARIVPREHLVEWNVIEAPGRVIDEPFGMACFPNRRAICPASVGTVPPPDSIRSSKRRTTPSSSTAATVARGIRSGGGDEGGMDLARSTGRIGVSASTSGVLRRAIRMLASSARS
jgi:hypothetical protein